MQAQSPAQEGIKTLSYFQGNTIFNSVVGGDDNGDTRFVQFPDMSAGRARIQKDKLQLWLFTEEFGEPCGMCMTVLLDREPVPIAVAGKMKADYGVFSI